jgi:membrane protease YdiL (CAAX protease family)
MSTRTTPDAGIKPGGRRRAHRRALVVYFSLAFLLSWLTWPLVALNPNSSPLVPFGPLIAAVVAAALSGGIRELGQLLVQLGRWRVSPRWYLVAILVPLLITVLTAALTVALADPVIELSPRPDWTQVAFAFASTLLLIGLFEEVGWRGYALPRLQRRMNGLQASLLLGAVWALWHLPELVSDPTGQRPPVQFVIFAIAQSVFLAWLYNSTAGSLPIVIISHAVTDTTARFALPAYAADTYQLVWWVQAGLWTMMAVLAVMISRSALGSGGGCGVANS